MQADVFSPLYEPINTYKPFAPMIGVADGPFEYVVLAGIKMPLAFTTRMTIVQLANGDLFLHSPIAFDPALAERLRSMGTVRHLVSPNRGHYAHVGEWGRAFPNAVTWASPGVRQRARSVGIEVCFERDLGPDAPDDWRDEMDQTIIPGAVLEEVVFFHRSSRTLIVADTIMNFELERLTQPLRMIAKFNRTNSSSRRNVPRYAHRALAQQANGETCYRESPHLAARTHHSQPRAMLREGRLQHDPPRLRLGTLGNGSRQRKRGDRLDVKATDACGASELAICLVTERARDDVVQALAGP